MVTRGGYLTFLRAQGITATYLPDNSPDVDSSLALAVEIVYTGINDVSPMLYDNAVYNLATSNLIEFATDQTGQTFFADLRTKYKINSFVAGLVSASGDESTSQTLTVPDWMKNISLADLQYLKTPWGRQYMSIAQRTGTLWGKS
jgi:hypothetical protein